MSGVVLEPTFENHLEEGWARRALVEDVRHGLARPPFRLTPRWLYDERGSELFDRITRLPEYYLTEAEREVLRREADHIAELTGADTLVELGSGTSDKTHTLLRAFTAGDQLRRFVPFDVSEETLRDAARRVAERYPGVHVHGIVGDFTTHLAHIPTDGTPLVAFLGSTIGNLYEEERQAFLAMLGDRLAGGGWFLVGVDLVKPVERLTPAYDDSRGVTAQFTRNVLRVINRELAADFDIESFDHVAIWDPSLERIDIRLRAIGDHHVRIPGADLEVDLYDGAEIHVEVSTKFRISRIAADLERAGFAVRNVWTDRRGDFAVVLARA